MKIPHFLRTINLLKVARRIRTDPPANQPVLTVRIERGRVANVPIPIRVIAHTGLRRVQPIHPVDGLPDRCQVEPDNDREHYYGDVQQPRDDREEDGREDGADGSKMINWG